MGKTDLKRRASYSPMWGPEFNTIVFNGTSPLNAKFIPTSELYRVRGFIIQVPATIPGTTPLITIGAWDLNTGAAATTPFKVGGVTTGFTPVASTTYFIRQAPGPGTQVGAAAAAGTIKHVGATGGFVASASQLLTFNTAGGDVFSMVNADPRVPSTRSPLIPYIQLTGTGTWGSATDQLYITCVFDNLSPMA